MTSFKGDAKLEKCDLLFILQVLEEAEATERECLARASIVPWPNPVRGRLVAEMQRHIQAIETVKAKIAQGSQKSKEETA